MSKSGPIARPAAIAVSAGGRCVAYGGKGGAMLWAVNAAQPVALPHESPTGFAFSSDDAPETQQTVQILIEKVTSVRLYDHES